jgi:type VI secretion system secreted protein VgrG
VIAARLIVDGLHGIEVRRVHGVERIGRPFLYEIEIVATDSIKPADVLAKPCALVFEGFGTRAIAGVVRRVTRVANQHAPARILSLRVEPAAAKLSLIRRCRIFRKRTVPEIVREVLHAAGYVATAVHLPSAAHPKREHITQLDETDLDFLHRMCEEEGLHLLYGVDPHDQGKESLRLEDTSTARKPHGPALTIRDDAALAEPGPAAYDLTIRETWRPGKVTIADYDHEKPDVELMFSESGGNDVEKAAEIYRAPAGFSTPKEGKALALYRLQAERMDASVLEFTTNSSSLEVGAAVSLEPPKSAAVNDSVLDATGDYMVVQLSVSWRSDGQASSVHVQAIPLKTPVRLRQVTREPKIAGLDVARVCGEPGSEIHPDSLGRVRLWFPWDIEGTTDHTSSLPVRVTQPNMPGSMNIPRVGWEQFVAFEDGDPDRPYAIGRGYNAAQPPPFSLPTNKQVTAIRSYSSPGGGGMNSVHMDDAAGRQHLLMVAESAKHVSVGASAVVLTEKNEKEKAASQTRAVSANQKVSVTESFVTTAASQSLDVGAKHSIYSGGEVSISVGGELVGVGGALLEKVGNPADGLAKLGPQAALSVLGVAGGAVGGGLGGALGIAGGLAGIGYAAYQAPPGHRWDAITSGAADMVGGMVPGANAVLAGVKKASGDRYPWTTPPQPPGPAAAGGGAGGGPGGGAGAKGPANGYKEEKVKGAYSEVIGAAYVVATPGKLVWETMGGELFNIGTSHKIRGVVATKNTGGMSTDVSSDLHIKAGTKASRSVSALLSTTVDGAYKVESKGGKVMVSSGAAMTVKATGLDLKGGKVTFTADSSTVSFSSEGLHIKASDIEINGDTHVDGDVTH